MALADLLTLPHFIIMLVGFIHLTISILLVVLHRPKKWYSLHVIFAANGVELVIIGLIILSGLILDIPHGIIGLIVIIFFIGELFSGIIATKRKEKNIRLIHIWVSRVIYIVALITIILGILNFI